MAYLGRGVDKISNIETLDNITFNGASSYTLQKGGVNFVPTSAAAILISIDGVVQSGNFTVSSSTIDFGTAIAGTSTCNFIIHLGVGLITAPSDGSVTAAKVADNLISGKTALATEPADTDEFLVSDAGTLKRIDYSLIKGSGKIIQVVTATTTTPVNVTGTTFTSTGLTASITPASTSNKVLILSTSAINTFGDGSSSSGRVGKITLRRGGATDTELTTMEIGVNARAADTSTNPNPHNVVTFTFLDSPSTTSSQAYTVAIRGDGACDIQAQTNDRKSSITLLEVAA